MIKADKKQKQIIAILTRGDKDFKAQLVVHLTGDSMKSSTNDLTFAQANQIIKKLDGTPVANMWTRFDNNNQAHRNVLSLLMQLGWQWYDSNKCRYFADLNRFGGWLQGQAPVNKPLMEMEKHEVSKIITALESMLKKDSKTKKS